MDLPLSHKPHLAYVKWLWQSVINPDDLIVDATLGNGHDTLWILKNLLPLGTGEIHGIDIQMQSIEQTKINLEKARLPDSIKDQFHPHLGCHSEFDFLTRAPKLIIYNFGYLPGSDKTIKTLKDTSLLSLQKALHLICQGGLITLTFYPGHKEGFEEAIVLENYLKGLDATLYQILKMSWSNRETSPYVVAIHKLR
jgi:hypothetical protein